MSGLRNVCRSDCLRCVTGYTAQIRIRRKCAVLRVIRKQKCLEYTWLMMSLENGTS